MRVRTAAELDPLVFRVSLCGSRGLVTRAVRVAFLREHLAQVLRARQQGIPMEGYFAWSLLDNFEWSEGYTLRYGVVHVDSETERRVPEVCALHRLEAGVTLTHIRERRASLRSTKHGDGRAVRVPVKD